MNAIAPRILLLQSADETRQPYDVALEGLGHTAEWFDSWEGLLTQKGNAPTAVVVDLDLLGGASPTRLEEVRSTFANSELIALSSVDSAQVALHCLRSGFTDFLLKPVSPEELAWSIRKAEQRRSLLHRLDDRKASLVRTLMQISSCNSPTLVRLCALESLTALFDARGAAWVLPGADGALQVAASSPAQRDPAEVLWRVPEERLGDSRRHPVVLRGKRTARRKVLLPCKDATQGAVILWGIEGAVPARRITDGLLLVQHCELSLLNLMKVQEIKQLTFLDDLTGLYNSRYLKFALTNAMLRCKKPGNSFSVLFIDVDHFKSVNDRHGHLVGSEFLITIGRTIKNAVRHVDSVFRYGGDEFVVILQDSPLKEARDVAERIRSNVERRVFVIGPERLRTTVSIGLAGYPETARDMETLLRLADQAMYSVKKESRNAVHVARDTENTL